MEQSSRSVPALGVTKFITIIAIHSVVILKSDLDVQQTHLSLWNKAQAQLLFRCCQNHNYYWYDFGHTGVLLKSGLVVQQTQF